jgi:hypothetical protein
LASQPGIELYPSRSGWGYSAFNDCVRNAVANSVGLDPARPPRDLPHGIACIDAILDCAGQQSADGKEARAAAQRALAFADSDGITPLLLACRGGLPSCVRHLLKLGVSPRVSFVECERRGVWNAAGTAPATSSCDRARSGSTMKHRIGKG